MGSLSEVFYLYKKNNFPQGFGKMYKKDGSIFIGQFINGVAEGPGFYAKVDGTYYKGDFSNNYL
jgi:hypothetical protein